MNTEQASLKMHTQMTTVDREIFVVKFFFVVVTKNENLTREINSIMHPQREQQHGEFSSTKRQVRFLQHGFQGSRIKQ